MVAELLVGIHSDKYKRQQEMGEILVQKYSSLMLDLCLRQRAHRKEDLTERSSVVCRLGHRWSRKVNCSAHALSEFSQIMRLGRQIDGRG